MSCLDITTCQSNQIYERINCNFSFSHKNYLCNSTITCQRSDGLYDCCASNIADCVIEYSIFQSIPTMSPTISSNIISECENTCNLVPSTNKCYWYESQNLDIFCIDKYNDYCCSHSRIECCQTDVFYVYIVYGLIFIILTLCIYYKYLVRKYNQVSPNETLPSLV